MAVLEKYYGRIDGGRLEPDRNEVALRLKTSRGYTNETVEKCKRELLSAVDCRYCAVRTEIRAEDDIIELCGFTVRSRDLAKSLEDCNQCFIMAVTLGAKVDMLLKRLEILSVSEHYITDGLASAVAERAADVAEAELRGAYECRPRFSAGYGDLPLEIQPLILNAIEARRYLGISLSDNLLMIPQKSITAFAGIKTHSKGC